VSALVVVRAGESHTVDLVGQRAGGKGINVARVLHQLGTPVHVTGLLGGRLGTALEADLEAAGIASTFTRTSGAAGAGGVVISDGPDGLVAVVEDGNYAVRAPRMVAGNPTGAGDAVTAALAVGLAEALNWHQILRTAIAWGAGAVAAECAGAVDEDIAAEIGSAARIEELA